jgi:hypothetical protein
VPEPAPIVHVGFPKTATTWFQKSFYPHVRNARYVDRANVNAAFLEGHALAFDPENARATLGLVDDEAVILCEEGLSGYLHNGGVAGFVTKGVAEAIHAALPEAHIVLFIRAQPAIITASYLQYVRSGGTHGPLRYVFPKDFLSGHAAVTYKQPRFDIDHFAYGRLVALYESLFGRERVHVFLYEEFQQDGPGFLRRYAAELGLEIDWGKVSLATRLPSYGLTLTRLGRVLNLFTARSVMDKHHLFEFPAWYQARRSLLEGLNRTRLFGRPPPPERLLGKDALRRIEAHFAEDNRRLAASRNLPLERFGYPMAPADRSAS